MIDWTDIDQKMIQFLFSSAITGQKMVKKGKNVNPALPEK